MSKRKPAKNEETDLVAQDLELRGFWLSLSQKGTIPDGKGPAFDAFIKELKQISLDRAKQSAFAQPYTFTEPPPEIQYGTATNAQNLQGDLARKKAKLVEMGKLPPSVLQEPVSSTPKPLPPSANYGAGLAAEMTGAAGVVDFTQTGGLTPLSPATVDDALDNMVEDSIGSYM